MYSFGLIFFEFYDSTSLWKLELFGYDGELKLKFFILFFSEGPFVCWWKTQDQQTCSAEEFVKMRDSFNQKDLS